MTYTPGDAVGIIPTNRESQVVEVLGALGFNGTERVRDHYKVEISLHEALTTRLGIASWRAAREPVCSWWRELRWRWGAGRRKRRRPRSTSGAASSWTLSRSSRAS